MLIGTVLLDIYFMVCPILTPDRTNVREGKGGGGGELWQPKGMHIADAGR
jgi:hypothetical protein